MMDEQKAQERFTQFLRALDGLSASIRKQADAEAKLAASVDRQVEAVAMLFDAISKQDDGLIAAIDDLRDDKQALGGEIAGLREDLKQYNAAMRAAITALVRPIARR